jgi:hypothetical protein
MEASQQQILATKKRVIRKHSEYLPEVGNINYVVKPVVVEPVVEPVVKTIPYEGCYCHCHDIKCDGIHHECLKCNKVGKWTEVYYAEFLCDVCIHGKCLYCQRGIYGKHYGEELCEPCFDKYKAWNNDAWNQWNIEANTSEKK